MNLLKTVRSALGWLIPPSLVRREPYPPTSDHPTSPLQVERRPLTTEQTSELRQALTTALAPHTVCTSGTPLCQLKGTHGRYGVILDNANLDYRHSDAQSLRQGLSGSYLLVETENNTVLRFTIPTDRKSPVLVTDPELSDRFVVDESVNTLQRGDSLKLGDKTYKVKSIISVESALSATEITLLQECLVTTPTSAIHETYHSARKKHIAECHPDWSKGERLDAVFLPNTSRFEEFTLRTSDLKDSIPCEIYFQGEDDQAYRLSIITESPTRDGSVQYVLEREVNTTDGLTSWMDVQDFGGTKKTIRPAQFAKDIHLSPGHCPRIVYTSGEAENLLTCKVQEERFVKKIGELRKATVSHQPTDVHDISQDLQSADHVEVLLTTATRKSPAFKPRISLLYSRDAEGTVRLQIGGANVSNREGVVIGNLATVRQSIEIGKPITIPGLNTEGLIVERVAQVSPFPLHVTDAPEVCSNGFHSGGAAYALGFDTIPQSLERHRLRSYSSTMKLTRA
jgi:hypothetical protein